MGPQSSGSRNHKIVTCALYVQTASRETSFSLIGALWEYPDEFLARTYLGSKRTHALSAPSSLLVCLGYSEIVWGGVGLMLQNVVLLGQVAHGKRTRVHQVDCVFDV